MPTNGRSRPTRCSISLRCAKCSRRRCWRRRWATANSGSTTPVAKYVVELDRDGDIGRVTLGQLATHTSGLLLPQDHPPWPDWGYTLPEFIRTLNAWKADKTPGQQHLYTHAGYVLLHLALERRYGTPIDELIEQRLLRPLAMTSTVLPRQDDSARGRLAPEHKRRAVQGYSEGGEPLG